MSKDDISIILNKLNFETMHSSFKYLHDLDVKLINIQGLQKLDEIYKRKIKELDTLANLKLLYKII